MFERFTAFLDSLAGREETQDKITPLQLAAAALMFAVMDADFAAGFLARMKPEAAAAIMAGLDPKVAYTISAVLAGRNARAPRN